MSYFESETPNSWLLAPDSLSQNSSFLSGRGLIPMAALVAVMIMVSIGTFSWGSLRNIKKIPRSETAVMLTTVMITVFSHNLAMGVFAGIALNAVLFARKLADLVFVDSLLSPDGNSRIYSVAGQIFFVSVNHFFKAFDFQEDLESIKIDLTHAHLWDQSAIKLRIEN